MRISTASIATVNGSRYLQQLCKHWGHRFTVTFDPTRGAIAFGDGMDVALAAGEDVLSVTVSAPSDDALARLEVVLEDHLKRFAFREALAFRWLRKD